LFLFGTENKFLQFWKTEKECLKTLQFAVPDEVLMKYFAATRFLIESESVSRDQAVNRILMTALINLMVSLLRRKKDVDFTNEYHRKLRQIYLNCYTINKIQALYAPPAGKGQIRFGDVREALDLTNDLVLVNLPVRINKSGFEKDRAPIEIMHLHGAGRTLESKLLGSRVFEDTDKTDWQMLLENEGAVYTLLNREALGLLKKLEKADRRDDAVRFFALWSQYHNILGKLTSTLSEQGVICVIAEHPFYKIDENFEEVPLGTIIRDMIRKDEENFPFSEPEIWLKQAGDLKFGHSQRTSILIMRKGSRQDSEESKLREDDA
jgi:hypothetical protein